ncbi:hypothetical protein SynRS9907_00539 [Synechococcus sp. RS9907]|nr:hypothetical protein SynRS9907_00539 [Synechococcus sp. RS9907]
MAKAKITDIFDNFGDIVGILKSGQSSDDLKPTLSGTLSKGLKKKEELHIFNGDEFLGQAKVKKKKWDFTPKSALDENETYSFKAIHVNKKGKQTSTSKSYILTLDNEDPTLVISNNIDGIAKGDITFDLNFSEPIDIKEKDIKIKGGKAGDFTGSGANYQYVVTPNDNSKGTVSLSINKGKFADLVGNKSAKKYSTKQEYDTKEADIKPPTFEIISDSKGVTNDNVTFDFIFSEEVQGFTSKDVKISGGSKNKFSGSGDSYTLMVSPDENSEGNIVIKTKAGIVTDLAGNKNTKKQTFKQAFDTKAPTYKISKNGDKIINGNIKFKFDFSEKVDGFTSKDLKISGGTKGKFSGSGDSYSVIVSPEKNKEGNIVIKTKAGMVEDLAGNKNTKGQTIKQAYDTKSPTLEITKNKDGITSEDVKFEFLFSEDIEGFNSKDIKISGGSSDKLKGSGNKYKLTVTPDKNKEGNITLKVNSGAVSDLAGNENDKGATIKQAFDTKSPELNIISNSDSNDDVTIEFLFSEDVEGFKSKDISITGGTAGKFSGSGGYYKLVVSPDEDTKGSIDIKVAKGAASDFAGNSNAVKSEYSHDYDTRIAPRAKDFVVPLEAQLEDTVAKDLNFGVVYSELVKAKDFPEGYFSADNFKIKTVSIDGGDDLSPSEAGITVNSAGFIKIDTSVDAYQYLNGGDEVDVVTKFKVTANNGLSDTGTVTFKVAGVDEEDDGTHLPGLAKNFVSPLPPQLENTVVKDLNFGEIYSELVRAKRYPDGTFTADSFELMDVTIFDTILSPSEAGITVNKSGSIKVDTTGPAYEDLNDGEIVDVVATFKVTDDVDQFDFGTVTFQVLGVTD